MSKATTDGLTLLPEANWVSQAKLMQINDSSIGEKLPSGRHMQRLGAGFAHNSGKEPGNLSAGEWGDHEAELLVTQYSATASLCARTHLVWSIVQILKDFCKHFCKSVTG